MRARACAPAFSELVGQTGAAGRVEGALTSNEIELKLMLKSANKYVVCIMRKQTKRQHQCNVAAAAAAGEGSAQTARTQRTTQTPPPGDSNLIAVKRGDEAASCDGTGQSRIFVKCMRATVRCSEANTADRGAVRLLVSRSGVGRGGIGVNRFQTREILVI